MGTRLGISYLTSSLSRYAQTTAQIDAIVLFISYRLSFLVSQKGIVAQSSNNIIADRSSHLHSTIKPNRPPAAAIHVCTTVGIAAAAELLELAAALADELDVMGDTVLLDGTELAGVTTAVVETELNGTVCPFATKPPVPSSVTIPFPINAPCPGESVLPSTTMYPLSLVTP